MLKFHLNSYTQIMSNHFTRNTANVWPHDNNALVCGIVVIASKYDYIANYTTYSFYSKLDVVVSVAYIVSDIVASSCDCN